MKVWKNPVNGCLESQERVDGESLKSGMKTPNQSITTSTYDGGEGKSSLISYASKGQEKWWAKSNINKGNDCMIKNSNRDAT